MVNQIIKAHVDCIVWLLMPVYYLPKSFLIRLINELTEQELNELARDTAKID